MLITADTLAAMTGRQVNDNMRSVVAGLKRAGVKSGLQRPQRLAMYLGQLAHESMGFHYDRELWGNTKAQKRYDTRTDLGNTAARDGDGFKYRGRGPIQITGKHNYAAFTKWAHGIDPLAPDFVKDPDAVLTDPWEGLGPIWYWDTHGLNKLADQGSYTLVTRRINGGTNGLADRRTQYAHAGLVLLGYGRTGVRQFQKAHNLTADGIAGPLTRTALHDALTAAPDVRFTPTSTKPAAQPTLAAFFAFLAKLFGANK